MGFFFYCLFSFIFFRNRKIQCDSSNVQSFGGGGPSPHQYTGYIQCLRQPIVGSFCMSSSQPSDIVTAGGGAPGSRERAIIRCPLHSVVLFKFSKCSGTHRSVSHAAVVVVAAQKAFSTGRSSQSNIFHCQFFFTDNP